MIDVRESIDKLKILIVDDSELNRELLAGMLGDEYEIYQVENGKKAIDILEENREQFKLVLLDINMPVMDGYEVLSIMKRRKWLDKLPVIVISAEISGESVRKHTSLERVIILYVRLMHLSYLEGLEIRLLFMIIFQVISKMQLLCCPRFSIVY